MPSGFDGIEGLRATFAARFGDEVAHGPYVYAAAPGRVELAGNHTDHQGGRVISAAVDLRMRALAAENGTEVIRASMEGFGDAEIPLSEAGALEPHDDETGTSRALLRGMVAQFARVGGTLRGFDLVIASDVPAGCGLSSSAAFEMLVGCCVEALFDTPGDADAGGPASGGAPALTDSPDATPRFPRDPLALALASRETEAAFFGKPSGAQDQIASAFGGAVAMDFASTPPTVAPAAFDARAIGHALCLIDTACDHSQHTDEFNAIPADMRAVAHLFGCERLADVDERAFMADLNRVRTQLGDRAALRALHYFGESARVGEQLHALERGDFEAFLVGARRSGASSAQYLQNVSPRGDGTGRHQEAMVVLALCAHLLGNRGAWRIHGGGFGGSVLAFVPDDEAPRFVERMNEVLGYDACTLLRIAAQGAFAVRLP